MGSGKVKMPKKKAKSDTISFHKYMLDLPDKNGDMQTYIIRSKTPLLEGNEPGETRAIEGDELSKSILSRNVLNLSFVELNVKSVYLTKAIKFEGKIIDEEPVGMSESAYMLNAGMKGNPSISIRYEGKDEVPEKKFNIISHQEVNPFTGKTRKA
jgi:hypothetical protein